MPVLLQLMEGSGGYSNRKKDENVKYLYLQYNGSVQYAYAVTTFEVRPVFLVVDVNFFF